MDNLHLQLMHHDAKPLPQRETTAGCASCSHHMRAQEIKGLKVCMYVLRALCSSSIC
jgi:hypothetical protein